MRKDTSILFILLLALASPLAGCATATPEQQAEMDANNDPWEPMNRHAYDTFYFLDRLIFRPMAELYRVMIPPPLRQRVTFVLRNMKEPVIFANDVLQGEFSKAEITAERFGINTTIGAAGMWDVAGEWDLYQQTGDFGQTLAKWGVGEGPFVLVPLYGPSDVRDAIGLGVDFFMSPWQYLVWIDSTSSLIKYEATENGMVILTRREKNIEKIDAFRQGSLDPYAQMRSAFRQYRRRQVGVKNGLSDASPDQP